MKSFNFSELLRPRHRLGAATAVVALATALGCSRSDATTGRAGSAAPAAPSAPVAPPKPSGVVNAVPVSDDAVTQAVNPKRLAPYRGPTATVRGLITIAGDPPPETPDAIRKFPSQCKVAREIYGRLFREGLMRSAADVLVTVSGYDAYVPPKDDVVRVVGRDCAWDRLTIGAMFGQRLEVSSRGTEPYMPQIVGAPAKALMIAVPRGDPVRLYPPRPGRFTLTDRVHAGMNAEVFVLKYPTFDVTGLDGRFEVKDVPPGEVVVGAILPATNKTASKKLRVEGGKSYDVNLEIAFDAAKDTPKRPQTEAAGVVDPSRAH
jgi:hypothetical protein